MVIVNDGSSDDTQTVISRYIASSPDLKVKLLNQANEGAASARNKGILASEGKYIALLDHDDIWYSEKLSECYEILKKFSDIDLVCHNELVRDASGKFIRNLYYGPYVPQMFRRLLFKGNCLSTSATVIKKGVLLEAGLYRQYPEFLEDYDLWLRLSKKYKIYFLPKILGEYLLHNNNVTLNTEWYYKGQIEVLRKNFAEYTEKKIFDFLLINLRISKTYLLLFRDLIRGKKFKSSVKYLWKAILHFPTYRYD